MIITDLDLPTDNSLATRIAWAGERHWDLVEGLLTSEVGWFVWNVVVGWADLCSTDDRQQYLAMAREIQSTLQKDT